MPPFLCQKGDFRPLSQDATCSISNWVMLIRIYFRVFGRMGHGRVIDMPSNSAPPGRRASWTVAPGGLPGALTK